MSIDLGAEQLIGAQKDNQKIAVEIKSFLSKSSAISEFNTALGQFINYRAALIQLSVISYQQLVISFSG